EYDAEYARELSFYINALEKRGPAGVECLNLRLEQNELARAARESAAASASSAARPLLQKFAADTVFPAWSDATDSAKALPVSALSALSSATSQASNVYASATEMVASQIGSATSFAEAAYTSAADYVAPMYFTASSVYVSKRAEAISTRDASRPASRSAASAKASARASSRSSKSKSKSKKTAGDGFRVTKPSSSSSFSSSATTSISVSPSSSASITPTITKIHKIMSTKIHYTPTAANVLTTVSRGEAWYSGYGIRTVPSIPISTAPETGEVGGLDTLAAAVGWVAAVVVLGKVARRKLRGVGGLRRARARAVASSSSAAASVPTAAPLSAPVSQVQGPMAPAALPRPQKLAVSARGAGVWRTM
ncbi:hypothetical protein LTS18_011239, partial [Coniosporium uncinatum]